MAQIFVVALKVDKRTTAADLEIVLQHNLQDSYLGIEVTNVTRGAPDVCAKDLECEIDYVNHGKECTIHG